MRVSHEIYNTDVKEHTFWKQISVLALRLAPFNGSAMLSSHLFPFYLKIEANLTSKSLKQWTVFKISVINRGKGQHCPIQCTSFLSKREGTVPQWEFKLNGALAAA
jgi:hypothetical protein